jgi:hypothetical protein
MDKPKKVTKPLADIDEDKVRKLAERQWSNVQIASFFDVDESTIRKRFPELLAKGREKGKGYLRDLQWKAATNGNSTMLVWLGKQYLGQTDKTDPSINQQIVVMGEIKRGGEPLRYNIGSPDAISE